MPIVISPQIRDKLLVKHKVTPEEVEECFANRIGRCILDSREEHKVDHPTLWFIAETYMGRKLKVVFVPGSGNNYVRTAYEPSAPTTANYLKRGGGLI